MSNPEKSYMFQINDLDDCRLLACVDDSGDERCMQLGICLGGAILYIVGDDIVVIDEGDPTGLEPGVYTVDMSDLRIFEEEV